MERDVGRLRPLIRQVLVQVLEDKAWVDDLMVFRRLKGAGPARGAEPARP